ncbi:hypothetical protein [Caenimonas koreensis]|uniref:Uncharacterized protein n=1 Tax=Caenimonas koreensis DSM 17982 TaxID=1121255 RepID=A0A844BCL2_9BURK|nr:hypothetical protein [Caenimonas koreensis]MRD49409.1 hypothetical protein [Caenimonas koreensis DSM 17982]
MRFASINVPKETVPERVSAAEILRRIVVGEPAAQTPGAEVRIQDLPMELDQRVRLVGEW